MSSRPPHRRLVISPIARAILLGVAYTILALTGLTWTPAAHAAQSLIPLPYPAAVSGGEPLDPEPQGLGGPQRITRDPYPRILGANAQGNPPISRVRRHQHLVPSTTERKYRVDRYRY